MMNSGQTFDAYDVVTIAGVLAFLALAMVTLVRRTARATPAYPVALLATSAWLAALTLFGADHGIALIAEAVRNLAWLWYMAAIAGRREDKVGVTPIGAIYVGLAAIESLKATLLTSSGLSGSALLPLTHTLDTIAMLFAAGALVLVHNLIEAGRADERRALTLPLGALAGLWAYDLNLYAISYMSGEPARLLLDVRPIATLAVAAALGIAVLRPAGHAVRISRPVAFRSLALAAVGGWLGLLALFSGFMSRAGGDFSSRAQVGVLAATITGMALLFLSPRLRALVRVWTVKHFFEHRYDYRAEWLRFTATLHRPEDGGLSLQARVVKALADMVESSGGILIGRDRTGHLTFTAEWPATAASSIHSMDWTALGDRMSSSKRIIQFDEVRAGIAPDAEAGAIPRALLDDCDYWIAVPLDHLGELEGIVLLARPLITRALDWEDFDLLKVAGRQAASHLAEARRAEALAENGRFEEFHRRFAFMMHDVKNLASQMGVLARNAERHGDNPEFRIDMVETLKLSAERLAQLMQRLSQQERVRVTNVEPVDLAAVARRIANAKRPLHPVDVIDEGAVRAQGDGETVEQLLIHLVQNAIDATRDDSAVRLRLASDGERTTISVEDSGSGMSPDFVRNQLFRPFNSTKEGGFGIGAYQARKLAEAMGGTLSVESREGAGTRFTLSLPVAVQDRAEPPLALALGEGEKRLSLSDKSEAA